MPDRRQVNANLVGSPGVQMRTQQVSRSKAGDPDKIRLRLPAGTDDCHTLSVSRISRDRFIDREIVTVEVAPDHDGIASRDSPGGDRRAQNAVRFLRLGHE